MLHMCYTIQSGDSLLSIAENFNVSVQDLIEANPQIITQAVICPNQMIAIPQQNIQAPWPTPQPTPSPWPTPEPTPSPWPTPEPTPSPWPTPEPTPSPSPSPGTDIQTQMEDQVIELVNIERTSRGLGALTLNRALANVARAKSEDMYTFNYFNHQSPTYGSPFDMLSSFGILYSAAAENIAKGQTSAQGVVTTWMNSTGHAANILNSVFTETGVGYVNNNGAPLWTQLFIRP